MDMQKIIAATDHTCLSPTATWEEIQILCDEAREFGAASVCVPPCYVREAASYLDGCLPVGTVIGFPHGNCTIGTKLFAAKTAILDGATEIEMVINLGYVKDGRFDKIFSEISGLKAMVGEAHILKVIVEAALLTDEEKVRMCVMVSQTGADFIQTATGFAAAGDVVEDVARFSRHADRLQIKAADGADTPEDAWKLLENGAHRLGSTVLLHRLRECGLTAASFADR